EENTQRGANPERIAAPDDSIGYERICLWAVVVAPTRKVQFQLIADRHESKTSGAIRDARPRSSDFTKHSVRHAAGQEAFEFARAHWVLELADGLGFDLPHALAGDLEDAADLLERVGVAVADAVAELDDLAL